LEALHVFWVTFFTNANLIKAMKLFRQPKNMIGKAKNIEMRKLPLSMKKNGLEKVAY